MPCPPCLQLSGCQPNYKSQYLLNTPLTSTGILCLVPFSMKLSSTSFFLILLLTSSFLQIAMAGSVIGGTTAFCSGKCQVRCSKASIKDGCLKYCNICCKECKCVPPGTYGNKDQCPCYRDKVVKGTKKPKCP